MSSAPWAGLCLSHFTGSGSVFPMRFILLSVFFFIASCSTILKKSSDEGLINDQEMSACFLLYDLKSQKFVKEYNPKRCKLRQAPCSTFKVVLAAMAFDDGILKDENTTFKWNGQKQFLDIWNQDHTAASWMKESVVWYSQVITKKMGRPKLQKYLHQFHYGNEDMSGGLTDAWLTPAPFSKQVQPSIAISGYEQIEFMKKLWTNQLPVTPHAHELTQKITLLEITPKGYALSGKTGSGFFDLTSNRRIGWFIAHIKGNGQEYLSVLNFHDLHDQQKTEFGGMVARKLTKEFLIKQGLY